LKSRIRKVPTGRDTGSNKKCKGDCLVLDHTSCNPALNFGKDLSVQMNGDREQKVTEWVDVAVPREQVFDLILDLERRMHRARCGASPRAESVREVIREWLQNIKRYLELPQSRTGLVKDQSNSNRLHPI
jgi:hypothetical protein